MKSKVAALSNFQSNRIYLPLDNFLNDYYEAFESSEFSVCFRTDPQHFTKARDETLAITERITKIEREINERVAVLYGVEAEAEARTQ